MRRLSIVSLMWGMSFIAIALAGLRNANDAWAGAIVLGTLAAIGASILAVVHARGKARARRTGFALFASAYVIVAFTFWFPELKASLGTTVAMDRLYAHATRGDLAEVHGKHWSKVLDLQQQIERARSLSTYSRQRRLDVLTSPPATELLASPREPMSRVSRLLPGIQNYDAFTRIGHCVSALIAGIIGAIISACLYREPMSSSSEVAQSSIARERNAPDESHA